MCLRDVIKKHFRLWSLIQVLSTKIGLFTPILRVHLDGLMRTNTLKRERGLLTQH